MGVDAARSWLAYYNGERFIKLNDHERAVQHYLRNRARQASRTGPLAACITYGDLCHSVDPDERIWRHPRYKGIGQALGHISLYEYRHGRPLLSALVVRAGSVGDPGDGFVDDLCRKTLGMTISVGHEHKFWQSAIEDVVRFWSDPDPMAAVDAMFDAVLDEIAELKQRLDTLERRQ